MTTRDEQLRLSRRATLRLLGGIGATALLAACGGNSATSTATTSTTSTSTAGAATAAAGGTTNATTSTAGAATSATSAVSPVAGGTPAAAASPAGSPIVLPQTIVIRDTGAKLPTEAVKFHWVDSGDSKSAFWKPFFEAYQKAHPNITVQYDGIPGAQIKQIVSLGVQNGNAPDAFQSPPGIPPYEMAHENWIRPLDDIIPDFAAWKQRFPPGTLVEGITMFNGKVYGCPYLSNRQYANLCLYNTAYLQQAGYDPTAKPLTWQDFRTAAKKVTEQGKGQYYGWIMTGATTQRWGGIVSGFAEMAGAHGGDMNWQTGQYNYTTDQFQAAIELLLALKSDGSVFPGSMQLDAPKAEAQMATGVAGIILQGPWNIPQWIRNDPKFNFGVAGQPEPDSGTAYPMTIGPGAFIPPWVYAKSQHPEIAGDVFAYITSEEGQATFAKYSQGFPPPILPQVRAAGRAAGLDPRVLTAYDIFDKQLRVAPDPRVRNPDTGQVYLEMKTLTPDFGTVVQGLYTGQLKDVKAAMKDVQDRSEAELQRAIKAAQAKGAKVSRDDWKFPNWDPTKDYTDADYKSLK
ncbi:MAG: ABC transporter substrate-binding protein [Thermomicrobiales bacterium]